MRISDWSSDVCSSDLTVTLLAVHDVGFGEFQIIQNAFCIGPLLEEIIILEKMIMAEGRMRDDERLHHRGVFFHDIADAGIGIRSEEHTSELQSLMRISYAVFCLKKKHTQHHITSTDSTTPQSRQYSHS